MLKNKEVQKLFLLGRITAGLGLGLFWPLWFLITCTEYSILESLFMYVMAVVIPQVGLLLFVSVWNTFEIKEVTKE